MNKGIFEAIDIQENNSNTNGCTHKSNISNSNNSFIIKYNLNDFLAFYRFINIVSNIEMYPDLKTLYYRAFKRR